MILTDYIYIFTYLIISIILAVIIYTLSYLIAIQKADNEKVSPYECGFNPFDDARNEFEVRFYLVAILFIIFDLEISFLFPWAISLKCITWSGYLSMFIFLVILTIGFIYEWKKGALEWE